MQNKKEIGQTLTHTYICIHQIMVHRSFVKKASKLNGQKTISMTNVASKKIFYSKEKKTFYRINLKNIYTNPKINKNINENKKKILWWVNEKWIRTLFLYITTTFDKLLHIIVPHLKFTVFPYFWVGNWFLLVPLFRLLNGVVHQDSIRAFSTKFTRLFHIGVFCTVFIFYKRKKKTNPTKLIEIWLQITFNC